MAFSFWKLTSYAVVAVSCLLILLQIIQFKVFPQSVFLWHLYKSNDLSLHAVMFSQIEHAIRFLITYPVLVFSDWLSMKPELLFGIQTNVVLLMTTINISIIVETISYKRISNKLKTIVLLIFFLFSSLFMNGRMIYAWLSFSIILNQISDYRLESTKDNYFIISILFALFLGAVSTGSFFVVCMSFYLWLFYYIYDNFNDFYIEKDLLIKLFYYVFLCLNIYNYRFIYCSKFTSLLYWPYIFTIILILFYLRSGALIHLLINILICLGCFVFKTNIILFSLYVIMNNLIIMTTYSRIPLTKHNKLQLITNFIPLVYVSFLYLNKLLEKVYNFYNIDDEFYVLVGILSHGLGGGLSYFNVIIFICSLYLFYRLIIYINFTYPRLLMWCIFISLLSGLFGYGALSMVIIPLTVILLCGALKLMPSLYMEKSS